MYLYNLTLQPATGINKAIYGNFSSPKAQEIVISRGNILELLRPDESSGQLKVVYSQEVFGLIRTLCPFRMTGANRDLLVVGSDSGRIAFFEFSDLTNKFEKVHLETYGKTGCRRIVPGQYIASDPKGRAVMVAGIEKQKFVYILNRDTNNRITISSPLEAHKNRTIIFEIAGVDVGFENPQFAVLEADYGDFEDPESAVCTGNGGKLLTFYEMDLGLNVVVRKYGEPIDPTANLIITVPGGADGPGGVLVCCENFIVWRKPGYSEVRTLYPRREDMADDRGLLMICYASHKQKDLFFFLIQSELGDLYKVTIVYNEDRVNGIMVQYFDTIFPCGSICVLKTGFLFAAAEYANQ